jgi:hypothetical protein
MPPLVNRIPFGSRGTEELDPPPPRPPGRRLRMAARIALWTLIGIAAIHGLVPPEPPSAPPRAASTPVRPSGGRDALPPPLAREQAASAIAAEFLREYLTLGQEPATRPARLKRYLARGVDLGGNVRAAGDVSQLADSVLPERVDPVADGLKVTVVAHLVQTRAGVAEDAGTVAFVVPLLSGPKGFAVSGPPRPAPLPLDPSLTPVVPALPIELARATATPAGRAVAALLDEDRATLVRLGAGMLPKLRPFPSGWRPMRIAGIRPTGPPGTPTVVVDVWARPSVAGLEYLVPVRVSFRPGAGGGSQVVTEIDAGDTP